jgi:hypothetical protein
MSIENLVETLNTAPEATATEAPAAEVAAPAPEATATEATEAPAAEIVVRAFLAPAAAPEGLVGTLSTLDAALAAARAMVVAYEALRAECADTIEMLSGIDKPRTRAFLASETRGAAKAAEAARSKFNDAARSAAEVRRGLTPSTK